MAILSVLTHSSAFFNGFQLGRFLWCPKSKRFWGTKIYRQTRSGCEKFSMPGMIWNLLPNFAPVSGESENPFICP